MFAKTTQVGFAQRVVATLVASAMLLWSVGTYSTAHAANLTSISDTLSTSEPSVTSSHTIEFTVPTSSVGIAGGDNIVVTFDSQDDGPGGQDFGGLAAIVDNSDLTYTINGGAPAAPTYGSSDADSFTISGIVAGATDVVEIIVADGVITNPGTIGSYEIEVSVANADSDLGRTRVAIVNTVLVTAIVPTQFDFTIVGVATSTEVFTGLATTTGSTTATAIEFGTLVAGTPELLAQQLSVQTNARNGFVVTVESDGDLESATGAIIDNFQNGSDVSDTGTTWTTPSNNVNDETTWGHWGLASNDGDLNSLGGYYAGEFAGTDYIAASTTPREVFHHDGPSDGSSADLGLIDVVYKIEITALQEAADDYNTTLTYIATPTF